MDFDLTAAAIIGVAAFADLAIKGIAFRRIDSFGLSLAAFSTVYSVVELARIVEADENAAVELQRFGWAVVPLLGLMLYHLWCRDDLENQIDRLFDNLATHLEDDGDPTAARRKRELLHVIKPVARKAVLVTFVGRRSEQLRPGKKSWREEVVTLVSAVAPDVDEHVRITEEKLLLKAWMRRFGVVLFLGGGLVAYLGQVITITA